MKQVIQYKTSSPSSSRMNYETATTTEIKGKHTVFGVVRIAHPDAWQRQVSRKLNPIRGESKCWIKHGQSALVATCQKVFRRKETKGIIFHAEK